MQPVLSGRIYKWAGTGLTLTLPDHWRRTDDDEPDNRVWAGPGKLTLSIHVAGEKPEWGSIPLDEQTKKFYEDHRKAGEQELRYLIIDGVNGVHYLRAGTGLDNEPQTTIIWDALREFQGKGQTVFVNLVSPASTFDQNREALYRLLAAIKFTQDASASDTSSDATPVIVSIPADGEFYLGKRRVAREQIVSEVDQMLRDRPEEKQLVYIKAGPEVSYRNVVDLFGDLESFGYERIGLVASHQSSLPKTRAGTSSSASANSNVPRSVESGYLVVTVRMSKGQPMIVVDGENVSLSQLSAYIHNALTQRATKTVMVQGDPNARYGLIVSIIDELKAGGAEPVGLDRLKN